MNKISYINYLITLTFLILGTFTGYCQKEASQWIFHQGSILDFNQNPPQLSFTNSLGPPAIASISNRKGELLFYTDGKDIFDSWHNIVPGGNGLTWMVNSSINDDSKIIIPVGINEQKYYLVTADALGRFTTPTWGGYITECCYKNDTLIAYTEIHVDKDKKISIIQKDTPLLKKGINLVAATKHANGIDTWLLTAEFNSNKLYAFLFTECGVMPPVISNSDPQHGATHICLYLKFSPDGRNVVSRFTEDTYLFDFDNSTGVVSNPSDISDCGILWKPAFSPNSQYVYSYRAPFSSGKFYLRRFDILNQTCDSLVFYNTTSGDTILGTRLSLAIDGKIYFISDAGNRYLGYYDNPDEPLDKANFKFKVYDTNNPGFNDGFGANFPNFISSYFDPNYATKVKNLGPVEIEPIPRSCTGQNLQFKANKTGAVNEYKWDFGDGTTAGNIKEPSHAYTVAGTYTVKLIVRYSCLTDTIRHQVIIDEAVIPPLGDTIYTCQAATFNAGGNYSSYLWNTGDTTAKITVNNTGAFSVTLKDGCGNYEANYHSIKPQSSVYNLITPDDNEKNDKLIFPIYPLQASIQVYDRWGQLVYQNDNYHNDWDAENLTEGIYYYKFNYEGCPEVKSWVQVVR